MKRRKLSSACALFVTCLLSACGLTNVKIGSPLDSGNTKAKVTMASKGTLFVAQKLYGKADCPSLMGRLSVSMSEIEKGKAVPITETCEFMKGNLVVKTKLPVKPGDYSIVVRRMGTRAFREDPIVYAKYQDPNFAGGADYLTDGAKELLPGQVAKGSVNYESGNATDWIRLKGKNVRAGVTLVLGQQAKNVRALVYDSGADGKTQKLLGVLQNRKKQIYSVKNGNILVKVSAKPYDGAGAYSLVRGDEGVLGTTSVAKGLKIPVIDCYQVGENNSVVLLQMVTGVKLNDEVSVYGRKNSGETVALGSCQVTSIVGSQASCKMEGSVTGFVEYHAEGRISG